MTYSLVKRKKSQSASSNAGHSESRYWECSYNHFAHQNLKWYPSEAQKNLETAEKFKWVPKLLRGIYRTDLLREDQNLGRKVEDIYMDEPCNAC